MNKKLVVKITCGAEVAEKTNQALSVTAAAVLAGVEVSLWLSGQASWFATPNGIEDFKLPHATSTQELFEIILEGASVTLCSQCALRRDLTKEDILPAIRIAGAAVFVEECMQDGAKTLVY